MNDCQKGFQRDVISNHVKRLQGRCFEWPMQIQYSLARADVSCCHCCARKRITKEIQDVSTKKQTYVTRKCSKNLCSEDRLMDIYISITPQLQNFAGLLTNLHLKNKLVIKRILLSSSQLITSVKVLLTTTKDNCTKTSFFLL